MSIESFKSLEFRSYLKEESLMKKGNLFFICMLFIIGIVSADDLSLCDTLGTNNKFYTLTDNLNSTETCITVTANNVTIDCNNKFINFSSTGSASDYGIYSTGNYTTIQNCVIFNGNTTSTVTYRHGIYFLNNYYGQIINTSANSTAPAHAGYGIYLFGSDFNNITNSNGSTLQSYGLRLNDAHNNTMVDSRFFSSTFIGLRFDSSNDNVITSCDISAYSGQGLLLATSARDNFTNNYFSSNSSTSYGAAVEDSQFSRFVNNTFISNASHAFHLSSAHNNTLINNTGISYGSVIKASAGIFLKSSHDNTLIDNYGQNINSYAIRLNQSDRNVLINNSAHTETYYSFFIYNSSFNNVTGNTAEANGTTGLPVAFRFDFCTNNTITNNTGNGTTGYGILSSTSSNNTFLNNTGYSNSSPGIMFDTQSNSNLVINNSAISNTNCGFYIELSNYNNLTTNYAYSGAKYDFCIIETSENNSFTNNIANSYKSNGESTNYFFSLENAMIHNTTNITIGNTNLSVNDGAINLTVPASRVYYLFNNYNINETLDLLNDSITVLGTTSDKTINSTLVDTIYTDVIFNVSSCNINYITKGETTITSTSSDYGGCDNLFLRLNNQVIVPGVTSYTIYYIVSSSGSSRRNAQTCVENWNCSDWSNCSYEIQTRQCSDLNSCDTEVNKSITSRTCDMPAVQKPVVEELQEIQKS
nr:hypothetical protein [Nanoarchaeum sp.]